MKKGTVNTDLNIIKEIIERDTEDIFIKESLISKLTSGKRLRVKLGIDPTSPNIHIGRANVLRKLRAFQDLGHTPVFIVGDFTAQIGDPSDKLSKRPMLSPEEIAKNLKNYKSQVGKIIDLKRAEFHYNSKWLSKLRFTEIAKLAETFSVQQMLARRNFSERYEKGEEISLREFLYPLMQGYDSVAVKADIEISGFDQLFNIKAGRIIQKYYGMGEQDVLTIKMLPGTDGRKMSSSWGNVIPISSTAEDMYGKVMAVHDDLIEMYFLQCTDVPIQEIQKMMQSIAEGGNPKEIKMRLAKAVTSIYYGEKEAEKAQDNFISVFSDKEIPSDMPVIKAKKGDYISDILVKESIVESKNEWKRLILGAGVKDAVVGIQIMDQFQKFESPITLKIGKRRFVRIEVE